MEELEEKVKTVKIQEKKKAEEVTFGDFDIDFSAKRKKKKKVTTEKEKAPIERKNSNMMKYTYEELLDRLFDSIKQTNPEIQDVKKVFNTKPPIVARVGTKKTAFVNFDETRKAFKRTAEHLLSFLLAELGTSGSVDGNGQLIIKGRFLQKQVESIIRQYVKEYVLCQTCKSSNTELIKDSRLWFLQCKTCLSRYSVSNIKAGFQAVTDKRKNVR